MSPEGEMILQVFRDRGLRAGALVHPADFGDAIVWEGGFVRDEPVRVALCALFDGGYLREHHAAFELTEVGDRHLYDEECIACGRLPLPGGLIHRTDHWLVEHCIGALGMGTLVVKPERHVTAVADLSDAEARELGPLLRRASAIAGVLVGADQVYNCLWSHVNGVPGHIHYVVQPVTTAQTTALDAYGPTLQVAMFAAGQRLAVGDVEQMATEARRLFEID